MLLAEAALQRKHCSKCPVHCIAAPCKSHSRLHSHSQGALVLHEELSSICSEHRCKVVYTCQFAEQKRCLLLHSRAVQSGANAAHHYAYVPVHAHCASFTACLVSLPFRRNKLQPSGAYLLLVHVCICIRMS